MTQNQIAYWQMKHDYDIRSQQVAETERSNKVKEAETERSNRAKENLQQLADLAKYGRTKYNPKAFEEIGQSVELFDVAKEVFDWIVGLFTGALSTGKRR